MRWRLFWVIIIIVSLGLTYFYIDPATFYIVPKCPFRLLTGFDCPACGIQRAFHHLLHCDWGIAIRYNYFLVVSVPYFVLVFVTTFSNNMYIQKARVYIQHPITVRIVLVLTLLWWILRNIPAVKLYFNML